MSFDCYFVDVVLVLFRFALFENLLERTYNLNITPRPNHNVTENHDVYVVIVISIVVASLNLPPRPKKETKQRYIYTTPTRYK